MYDRSKIVTEDSVMFGTINTRIAFTFHSRLGNSFNKKLRWPAHNCQVWIRGIKNTKYPLIYFAWYNTITVHAIEAVVNNIIFQVTDQSLG